MQNVGGAKGRFRDLTKAKPSAKGGGQRQHPTIAQSGPSALASRAVVVTKPSRSGVQSAHVALLPDLCNRLTFAAGPNQSNKRASPIIAPYDQIAQEWDQTRATFFRRERECLDLILAGLPAGSCVLDLGCGTGRPMAEHVLAGGHHLVGVDASRELLARARDRFPQATWIEARIETYEISGTFDAAICWDALFHLPREHHEGILRRIAAALRPRGRVGLTSGGSAHPPFTDVMFGHEFFYDSHPPDEMRSLIQRCGFSIIEDISLNPPTTDRDKGRLAIVAEKTA